LVKSAWVVEQPGEVERPLRIHRHGSRLDDAHRAELAEYLKLVPAEDPLGQLSQRIEPPAPDWPAPPTLLELCRDLDRTLAPRIGSLRPGAIDSFSGWYAYLYRGASAFVHPSANGIRPLIEPVAEGLQVSPSRATPEGVLRVVAAQTATALLIAAELAPWLGGHAE
jgi:hypothetical protein